MFEIKTRRVQIKGKELEFYYLPHPGAVAVVPVRNGEIALIKQLRPSIERVIWEVPAGTLEPGEEPAACAARELAEETGYRAEHITPISTFYLAPGYSTEYLHLFKAEGLTPGPQALEEGESIEEIRWFSLKEAHALVHSGEIVDAKSIIAIQALLLADTPVDKPR